MTKEEIRGIVISDDTTLQNRQIATLTQEAAYQTAILNEQVRELVNLTRLTNNVLSATVQSGTTQPGTTKRASGG